MFSSWREKITVDVGALANKLKDTEALASNMRMFAKGVGDAVQDQIAQTRRQFKEESKKNDHLRRKQESLAGWTKRLPWMVEFPGKEHLSAQLKIDILTISSKEAIFHQDPPSEEDFPVDMELACIYIQEALKADPDLEQLRFKLVPRIISETHFCRKYLIEVAKLRAAAGVEPLQLKMNEIGIVSPESNNAIELTKPGEKTQEENEEPNDERISEFDPSELEAMLNDLPTPSGSGDEASIDQMLE